MPTFVIMFRGFMFSSTSQAELPLGKDTLKYGSDDQGQTMKSEVEVEKLLDDLAKQTNLKKHEFRGHKLFSAVDVEIHKLSDDRSTIYSILFFSDLIMICSTAKVLFGRPSTPLAPRTTTKGLSSRLSRAAVPP